MKSKNSQLQKIEQTIYKIMGQLESINVGGEASKKTLNDSKKELGNVYKEIKKFEKSH